MQIWTFLHILSMFAAVTVVVGTEWWATYAVRRRDAGALRAYFRVAPQAEKVGTILFLLGIVFGLIAAVVIGWNLLVPWLLLTYVLVVVTIAVGFATVPYLKRVEAALPQDGDASTAEFEAITSSPTTLVASAIGAIAVAAIVALMVYKPTF
jgi:uncharacterized membrane protein